LPTFILDARRTPFGALGGSLKGRTAPELAGALIGPLLAGLDPGRVEELILGQAVQAGAGPDPAGQAARRSGLPPALPAMTLNQGLASGFLAVLMAARGGAELALAGGMESASSAPYLLPSARWGTRMGTAPVLDALLGDADWPGPGRRPEAREDPPAGQETFGPEPDDPAPAGELLPGDGAALLLLGSERQAASRPPLARLAGFAMGVDEAEALRRVLAGAGLTLGQIHRFELECPEAWPELAANRRGGPPGLALGAEGARRLVTLAHQLRHHRLRHGVAALQSGPLSLAILLEAL